MGFFDWFDDLMDSLRDALDDFQEHMSQVEMMNMSAQEENRQFMDDMLLLDQLNQAQNMMDDLSDPAGFDDFADPGMGMGGM